MAFRFPAVLAMQFLLAAGASAAETAPAPLARIGNSEKICQLTGDTDWETGQPTAARTLHNFGLRGVDLGFPVEHVGKLIFLFGDTFPSRHGDGPAGEIPPDDAVGVSERLEPPGNDGKCLELQIHQKPGAPPTFAPATITGPVPIKQGFFNVPSGGVSVAGSLHAFFFTDHCTMHARLKPSSDYPLARPPASPICSENDDRSSIGRGVMARSDDEGRTFSGVIPMPAGFVYSIAVDPQAQADLPAEQRQGILVFGVPRYRASVPYLAQAPAETFANPATWRFFTGRAADGQPKWVTQAQWQQGVAGTAAPRGAGWKPPGEPEILAPASDAEHCIGEFSITWNQPLHLWLMLYGCAPKIEARVAAAPWGPWSAPIELLGKEDDVGCRLIMIPAGCGNRQDFWPSRRKNGMLESGAFYAPFVLDRFTIAAAAGSGASRSSTIYWLVSTWNPYEVTVMRTTLKWDLH